MTYFLARELKKGKAINIEGVYIVDGDVSYNSSGGGSGNQPRPNIELPNFFGDVKWILPPRSSGAYGSVRSFAESMGYETVEHDDFSYPSK